MARRAGRGSVRSARRRRPTPTCAPIHRRQALSPERFPRTARDAKLARMVDCSPASAFGRAARKTNPSNACHTWAAIACWPMARVGSQSRKGSSRPVAGDCAWRPRPRPRQPRRGQGGREKGPLCRRPGRFFGRAHLGDGRALPVDDCRHRARTRILPWDGCRYHARTRAFP